MDGLLFDSEALYRDAILAAARDLGHRFTAEDFLLLVGRPAEVNRLALQEHIGPAHDVEVFRAAWLEHYRVTRPTLALKPGARELLDRLDELGMARAICTSSGHEDVAEKLALHGLLGRFDTVVASGDYARGKPARGRCPRRRTCSVLGAGGFPQRGARRRSSGNKRDHGTGPAGGHGGDARTMLPGRRRLA